MSKVFYSVCQQLVQQLCRSGLFLLRLFALRAGNCTQTQQLLFGKHLGAKISQHDGHPK